MFGVASEHKIRIVDNALWDLAYDGAERRCGGAPRNMYSRMDRHYQCGTGAQIILRITKAFAEEADDAVSVQLLFRASVGDVWRAMDAISCCSFCLHSASNISVICQTLDTCLPLQCCVTSRCVEYEHGAVRIRFENVERLGYFVVFYGSADDKPRLDELKCELGVDTQPVESQSYVDLLVQSVQ